MFLLDGICSNFIKHNSTTKKNLIIKKLIISKKHLKLVKYTGIIQTNLQRLNKNKITLSSNFIKKALLRILNEKK